jgi:hypothetical protein
VDAPAGGVGWLRQLDNGRSLAGPVNGPVAEPVDGLGADQDR